MRQTAPKDMMIHGHLHYVRDLESFEKLRSQDHDSQLAITPNSHQ